MQRWLRIKTCKIALWQAEVAQVISHVSKRCQNNANLSRRCQMSKVKQLDWGGRGSQKPKLDTMSVTATTLILRPQSREYLISYLITSSTTRSDQFCIMSLTVQRVVLEAIHQIHQQFFTMWANKARWVPAEILTSFRRKNSHIPCVNFSFTCMALLKYWC